MQDAASIINEDLDNICDALAAELPRLAGRTVLITGGAGFLGYYLVQGLLHANTRGSAAAPIKISVYDNFSRGMPGWLEKLSGDPHLDLVRHDITHPLPPDFPDFDFIIHAASIASPIFYRKHPIETMDANVNGLRFLLEHCRARNETGRHPVEGFLFYSTSEIYGDPTPENIPTPETYRGNVSCTGPRACYDESKRYGETLCVNFAEVHGLPIKTARPFNNYGPGLKITDGRVLPDMARDILAGRDIVMLSDGSPTRTFCYITDAIAGYLKILVRGRPGEAYNIGVETPEISIGDAADMLARIASQLFGYKGKVVRGVSADKNYLVDNPNRRCPDIRKARAELDFKPVLELEDGLRRMMIWYAANQAEKEEH
ncbi:MAG: NAD-dependent epimerase/dehydratase family protein [Opitutaceae bacterium]